MPVPPLLLTLGVLASARAGAPSDAPGLRLKLNPAFASTATTGLRREGEPLPGVEDRRLTQLSLPTGDNRVELTWRLSPRLDLGGTAALRASRVAIGDGATRSGPELGLGLTAAYTWPVGDRVGLFAQGLALYERSWAPGGEGGAHGLWLAGAGGLRLPLSAAVTLDPALELARGAARAWPPPEGAGAPLQTVELRVSGRIGISVSF